MCTNLYLITIFLKKNGIYYFKDRFAENYPEEADTNINDRAAYNITFAIFDLDTNKLYIYKLDT